VDFDNSGSLSYDEFVFLMTKWNKSGGDERLNEAFSLVKARVSKIEALKAQFDKVAGARWLMPHPCRWDMEQMAIS